MNKIILIGNVGKDPEVRHVGGSDVAKFSIATTERWNDRKTGEKKTRTDWHQCQAWGALAGVIDQFVTKGTKLAIVGSIKYETWQDKTGVDRTSTVVYVSDFEFLSARPTKTAEEPKQDAGSFDDIPF